MKKYYTLPLIICVLSTGCNLKTAAQKAQDKADQQSQQQAQKQTTPDDALASAKEELHTRIALYHSFVGEYAGNYTANDNSVVSVKVGVTVANEPAETEIDQMTRDTDVLQRLDAISLDFETKESLSSDSHYSFFCDGRNLKPDFSRGVVRFECAGETAVSAPRVYVLALDTGDTSATNPSSSTGADVVSSRIGGELVSRQITRVDGFRLSIIMNPEFGTQFSGVLIRQN